MANRILRESICTSETVNQLTWFEEVCFYRLIVQCDDFGRMDARLPILRARLFPIAENVTTAEIGTALDALESVGLLERYTVDEMPYLQLVSWEKCQRVRNKRSRYPPPWPILEADLE
jgi:hypothetical protein